MSTLLSLAVALVAFGVLLPGLALAAVLGSTAALVRCSEKNEKRGTR